MPNSGFMEVTAVKRRSSIKATSVLITLAMVMSLSGYVFADETEETIPSEEQNSIEGYFVCR